jgi:hypothetical protein
LKKNAREKCSEDKKEGDFSWGSELSMALPWKSDGKRGIPSENIVYLFH